VLALVAAGAVLAPWTVRNAAVFGRLVPIRDSFGKEFWMGNNLHATGTSYAAGGTTEITYAHPPDAFALKGRVPEAELMDALLREGAAYAWSEPGGFVARTAKKILWFWTAAPAHLVRSTLGGEAVRFRGLHLGYWIFFLACSAFAWWYGGGVPVEYGRLLTLYVTTYSLLYGLTHVGQARYRGEMEFIFVPLVAAGLVAMHDLFIRRGQQPDAGSVGP
jgi:hypothetical protein